MKFIDAHPAFNSGTYFAATNEEPELHLEHARTYGGLKRRLFKRAGSICSGGEVPLFALVNICKEVVAVDHSYRAIRTAMSKALLLKKLGPAQYRDLAFTDTGGLRFVQAIKDVEHQLPEPVAKYPCEMGGGYYCDTRNEILKLTVEDLARVHRRLRRLTFVHGDFTDLATMGPFDILYLSNALEYAGRTKEQLRKGLKIETLCTEGALILSAGEYTPDGATFVKSTRGHRTSWYHKVTRFEKEKVA